MANVSVSSGIRTTGQGTGVVDLGRVKGNFSLDFVFASTGSVTLRRAIVLADGTLGSYKDVKTYTATGADEGYSGAECQYQLNFTAIAGNIEYALAYGQPVVR